MKQFLTASIIATLAVAMIFTTITSMDVFAAKPDKKPVKCNNFKVQVTIGNVQNGTTLVTTATVGDKSVTKVQTVELEENETSIKAPLNFKKITCPTIGSEIFGNVNGTGFTGEVKSLNKSNKISVDLP